MTALTQAVAVIGAGYAGMACAVELARQGVHVTVFEQTLKMGGRARLLNRNERQIDNGQFILNGTYTALLRLLRNTGTSPRRLMHLPLTLNLPGQLHFRVAGLPAPFHFLAAVLRANGLYWRERRALLHLARYVKKHSASIPEALTVDTLLDQTRQPERLRRLFWNPLCHLYLNTPPAEASARIFSTVLKNGLLANAAESELLFPRIPPSELFPFSAARFLATHRGRLRTGTPVSALTLTPEGYTLEGDDASLVWPFVVIATMPDQAAHLLEPFDDCAELSAILAKLPYRPMTTVYFDFETEVRLPAPLLQLDGDPAHWAFDLGTISDKKNCLACVIHCGDRQKAEWKANMGETVLKQLERLLQQKLPAPEWFETVTEDRATLSCIPGLRRPGIRTPHPGLFLAGDYIDGPMPGNLEMAIRSGQDCARAILANITRSTRG